MWTYSSHDLRLFVYFVKEIKKKKKKKKSLDLEVLRLISFHMRAL